jgi:hypothetical protein
MARATFQKREREMKRKEKATAKSLRQEARAAGASPRAPREDGVDPDIAGIIPGPQPLRQDD